MRKIVLFLALSLVLCQYPVRAAGTLSQSGEVVAAALGQMGYTEGEEESTLFGQLYGYPNGFWCDMFVSWCADEARVPEEDFPRSASCGEHYRQFRAMGRYRDSAARGGSYVPQQGDLILFRSLRTGIIHHIGLVLYVENGQVFAVEGNALTDRLDYPAEEVSAARRSKLEPKDYVTVNQYPLYSPEIHGYAIPAYSSREALELEGFVDLGRYEFARAEIEAAAALGLVYAASSHTFSPRAGMSGGAFLETAVNLCGLSGWEEDLPALAGVPQGSRYYDAVMTARSTGLLPDAAAERFEPERWISGEDAQAILSAALACLGQEDQIFSLEEGDLSRILTPYAARGDLAQALYAVWQKTPAITTERCHGALRLNGKTLDWPMRTLDGCRYVSLTSVMNRFPEVTSPEAFLTQAGTQPDGESGGRAAIRPFTLRAAGKRLQVRGFYWSGIPYVPLEEIAPLLPVQLKVTG